MLIELPIKNEKNSIVRPIVLGIISDLRKHLSIVPKDTEIIYLDEEGVRLERGSNLNPEDKEDINTQSTPQIQVTVTEEYMDSTLLQYQHFDQEFRPIFSHDKTGTHISPYYSHVVLKINFSFKATSKAAANAWLNLMKSKIRSLHHSYQHILNYHYEINREFIYILSEVHRLIKNQVEVSPLSDWLCENFTNRFGTVSDTAGKNRVFAITESQYNVRGFFDFDTMIEQGEKVDNTPAWVANFDYRVDYWKPTTLSIWYPLVVYNQIVPQYLLPTVKGEHSEIYYTELPVDWKDQFGTQSQDTIGTFGMDYKYDIQQPYEGIVVPNWSEFYTQQAFSIEGLDRFVDMLILFDKDDKPGSEICSLADPQGYTMDEQLIQFLISEKDYLLMNGHSVFQLAMYQNDKMLRRDFIKIDDKGHVTLNGEIMIEMMYHLRLGIYYDWSTLTPEAISRLKQFNQGTLYQQIIHYLQKGGLWYMPQNNNDWRINDRNPWLIRTVQVFNTEAKRKG